MVQCMCEKHDRKRDRKREKRREREIKRVREIERGKEWLVRGVVKKPLYKV